MSCHKLVEEAHVIFREETEVFHLIFQVGDALYTHTEGIAFIDGGVNAISFKYSRVHHAATEDFHPASVLAESATVTSADVARNVHFCRRFGEGEVGGTQTNLSIRTEHLTREGEQHLFQVGE